MLHIWNAEYYYSQQPRLQLFFESPNYCAVALGMFAVVLSGLLGCLLRNNWSSRLRYAGVFLLAGLGLFGLALTYSRGGWLATIVGMLILGIGVRRIRKSVCLLLLLFVLSIVLIPKGSDRTMSFTDKTDLSILHRLEVWRGALAMTADYWQSGVGRHRFGTEFALHYEPPAMHTNYEAALNDFLTLGAEQGIFVLALYLFCIIAPWWAAWCHARKYKHTVIIGNLAAQTAFFVSGLFTYALTVWAVSAFFGILYLSIIAYLFYLWWKKKELLLGKYCIRAATLSILLCSAIFCGGYYFSSKIQTSVEPFTITTAEQVFPAFIVTPRHIAPAGYVLYYKGKGTNLIDEVRFTLRALAEKGYIVIAADYSESGLPGLEDVKTLNAWFEENADFNALPHYLLGKGLGARLSIVSMCMSKYPKIQGIAAVESELHWPFPEISPADQIQNLSCPLLIINRQEGGKVSLDEANQLKDLCEKSEKAVELISYQPNKKNPEYLTSDVFGKIALFFTSISTPKR